MVEHNKNQLSDVLLTNGLDLLHRGRERVADRLIRTGKIIRSSRFHRLDRLKWVLVGVGAGVGLGMLLAPLSGSESRENISNKVHDLRSRVRDRLQVRTTPATGTHG